MPGRGNYWKPGGLNDGVVKIEDLEATALSTVQKGHWEELGRAVSTGVESTLTVSGLPVRKFLQILYNRNASANTTTTIRFNGDSSVKYSQVHTINGVTSSVLNQTGIQLDGAIATQNDAEGFFTVRNVANKIKLISGITTHRIASADQSSAPKQVIVSGAWYDKVNAINSVSLIDGGTPETGTEIVVLGQD